MPSGDALQEAVVEADETVRVELYVRRERARGVADDARTSRFVPLLRAREPQRRHLDEPHDVVAGRAGDEQPVAQDRKRVEERRREDVEEVGVPELDGCAPSVYETHVEAVALETPP